MDALRRVRARYEPERNKGTERVSVFLAPIQPDLDLFAAGRIERKRRRGEKRFPWWTVFGCQAQNRDVKNAFRNRERFSMLSDYNVLAGLESFLPLLLLLFWGKMVSSDSLCEFIVDRTGNLRNSIEMRYVTNVAS